MKSLKGQPCSQASLGVGQTISTTVVTGAAWQAHRRENKSKKTTHRLRHFTDRDQTVIQTDSRIGRWFNEIVC